MDRRRFFDEQAPAWDRIPPPQEASLRRVVELAGVAAGHRVLDVGAGTGVLGPLLLAAAGEEGQVVAFDISRGMIAQAAAKLSAGNLLLVQADVHRLPFPEGAFDRVICNAAFPHFGDRRGALGEMARVLGPGGVLVISHPIGRAAVNARHREAGGAVGEDRVPPPEVMEGLLREAGLVEIAVVDEPEFYLARARRP